MLQDNFLFAATVRDNIAWGTAGATSSAIEEAARLANAHEFITALPKGYETVLGERGVTVSQGQRQRIAIARAAIRNVPILILDEPTTGLDKKNQHAVLDALDRLNGKCTVFLITHDLECTARADRIVFLEQGQIVEQGTHDALLSANGRYAALFRLHLDPGHSHLWRQLHAIGR